MSALSKMAKTLNRDKSIDTAQYLAEIHRSLLVEVRNRKIESEDAKALRIQTFLRQIKYIQQNNLASNGVLNLSNTSDFPFSPLWSKISQITLMEELYRANPHIFQYNLFTKIKDSGDSEVKSYKLGAYLEQGMAQVLNTLESSVTGVEYSEVKEKNNSVKMGTQHTQVPDLLGITDDIMKAEFNRTYLESQKALKKYQNNTSNIGTFMPSVEGKIDISGYTASLIASGKTVLTPYTKSILNALKGATFTAKNYISTQELKFGQTNPFRIFTTVAPGGSSSIGRFYRMLNCFKSHDIYHSDAPVLFYRIKAIYELTGIGMQYTNSMFNTIFGGSGARYLVWNNPMGEIYVIPTQKIINELIETAAEEILPKNWQDALYGPVVLPQVDISKLTN